MTSKEDKLIVKLKEVFGHQKFRSDLQEKAIKTIAQRMYYNRNYAFMLCVYLFSYKYQ